MKRLGVDAGNDKIKIAGENGVLKFSSVLGEYRERNLKDSFSDNDIVYQYKDRKGFAGTLAEIESEFAGSLFGTTKAHEDTLIRVLLGITQYGTDGSYAIIVGQPIKQHSEEQKMRIKEMLLGDHEIVVNDRKRRIIIERCEVSAEGGVAFWSNPKRGKMRILDFGSGTVNGATLIDGKYVDRDSFTTEFGLSTIQSTDRSAFMRAVYIETQRKRWNKSDPIYVVGGAADEMLPHVQNHFDQVEALRPKLINGGEMKLLHPEFANAVGMYNVAKEIFK